MSIPDEVREAVSGRPWVGAWNSMLPLVTVDEAGYPHVCLLSQAELDADDEHLYAVLASPTTMANLLRTGQATLVVVTDDAAVYTKLNAVGIVDDGDWLGMAFAVEHVKRDGIGVPLTPPRYLATQAVAEGENWERSERLLTELNTQLMKETR